MDSLTHALLGALAAAATAKTDRDPEHDRLRGSGLDYRPSLRTVSCVSAALLPDLDYLLFWIDPLQFLAYWHRGLSHSLLMLPLWSLVLSLTWAGLVQQWWRWRQLYLPCALGLASHIAADLLTAFGVQLFAPLSTQRYALALSYVVDPLLTALVLTGLLLIRRYRHTGTLTAACLLVGYLGSQWLFKQQALAWAQSAHPSAPTAHIHVLPQPLGPQHWKLVVEEAQRYHESHICLGGCPGKLSAWLWPGWLAELAGAYQPSTRMQWQVHFRWGTTEQAPLVIDTWQHPKLNAFRDFARLPALYRVDDDRDRQCIWFTDRRYALPTLLPFFRFGLCRPRAADGFGDWQRYRLRRFSTTQAQALD